MTYTNIKAAFEEFIANANAKSGPVKGVTYKVEAIDDKILVSATFDAAIGYTDEPWCNFGDMPDHDRSYEIANDDGTVISYVEYDLSGSGTHEGRAVTLAGIAQMAIDNLDLDDTQQSILIELIDHLEQVEDEDFNPLGGMVFDVKREDYKSDFEIGYVHAAGRGEDFWTWAYTHDDLSAEQFIETVIGEDMSWWEPEWDEAAKRRALSAA